MAGREVRGREQALLGKRHPRRIRRRLTGELGKHFSCEQERNREEMAFRKEFQRDQPQGVYEKVEGMIFWGGGGVLFEKKTGLIIDIGGYQMASLIEGGSCVPIDCRRG